MMKILWINKFLYPRGGAETYVLKLGACQSACGHEVQYFGMDDERRTVGNRCGAYTRNMEFQGAMSWEKMTYAFRTLYSVESRKKLRLVLEDFQPDVCHLNNFNYHLTPSILLEIDKWRKETGRKCSIVYTAHDYNLICPNHLCKNPIRNENCEQCMDGSYWHCAAGKCIHESFAKSLLGSIEAYFWHWKKVYRLIDIVICCSEFMKKKMASDPVFSSKSLTLHNFVEPVLESKVERDNYILYFGRYSEEKGIDTLVSVCKELPDIPVIFAGSGPQEYLLKTVPNIKNVGFQSWEELKKLIQKAQFTVYPSQWYENCPFSVLESLACQTPVLGADIGGIPELIRDGITGELFASGDKEDLKKKISGMWTDKKKCRYYQEQCRKNSFDTMETYAEKLIKIYESLE